MKKTISINIAGILFNIEEDGYDKLRSYLDGIAAYFRKFEGSAEIIADIESRIAEILLARKGESGKIISAEDIDHVIQTMGKVSDFQAVESVDESEPVTGTNETGGQGSGPAASGKKLFRDTKRQVLGGVCAGLSHRLRIDPVWLRLAFALLIPATSGIMVIAYIVLWISMPGNENLEEQESIRKMYRNPEGKVLGGVASGIASYTGWDIAIIRVIWVLFAILGGSGVIFYIILWIALPEANSLTEKMRMQGQPVTLSNIEKTVKERLNEKPGEESTLAKIILFPFRAIATILGALGKALGPIVTTLVKGIRILTGLLITVVGITVSASFLIVIAILSGLLTPESSPAAWTGFAGTFPLEAFQNTFSIWTLLFAGLALIIPFLYIGLLGISLIVNRLVIGKIAGWSIAIIFLISAIWSAVKIPATVMHFQREGTYRTEQSFTIEKGTPVLGIREAGLDSYPVVDIRLKSHGNADFRTVNRFEAQGRTRKEAIANAQTIEYSITQEDSTLLFDSNIRFRENAPFRAQRLTVEVYVPYGRDFIMTREFSELVENRRDYFDAEDEDQETLKFRMDSAGLKCLSCPPGHGDEEWENDSEPEGDASGKSARKSSSIANIRDDFGFKDFDAVELSGAYHATILQGDRYAVQLSGSEEVRERFEVHQEGNTLVVKHRKSINFIKGWANDHTIEITVIMPELNSVEATGAGEIELNGFDADRLEIKLTGAVKAEADVNARELEADLTGASQLELEGKGDNAEISLTGASTLNAFGFKTREASVDATGASTARVYVTESLEIDETLASKVHYKGNPKVLRN